MGTGTRGYVALPGICSVGLCEELQSARNYSLGLNKFLVTSVLAVVRVTRRMFSVGCPGQQLIGVLGQESESQASGSPGQGGLVGEADL